MKHLKDLLFLSILCSLLVFTNCDKEEATCAICDDYSWSINGLPTDTFKNSLTRCVGNEYLLGTALQKDECHYQKAISLGKSVLTGKEIGRAHV